MSYKRRWLVGVLVALSLPIVSPAAEGKGRPAKPPKLTAEQIVQRHLAARGGLKAWHGVESMVWKGTMEVGFGDSVARSTRYVSSALATKAKGARSKPVAPVRDAAAEKQVQVPFVLELKRPTKSRIEIEFAGKTAVQVYDGTNGWMYRPFLNRDDWQPFNEEQARSQRGKWDLDGPRLDAAANGTKVAFESVERVDGRDAYKLKLTHKDGEVQRVWIDAKTFLDVKVQGTPRRMDGKLRTVWVTQRDFRPVQGVMVPFVLETAVDGYSDTHKMFVKSVAVNPKLDDARFAKPKA